MTRRIPGLAVIALGIATIVVALVNHMFAAGPVFGPLLSDLRPIMTQQAVTQMRSDLDQLQQTHSEFVNKGLPTIAGGLQVTPTQLQQSMATNFPAVTAGLQAMPPAISKFRDMSTLIESNIGNFQKTEAIPTSNIPAKTVPWAFLGLGVVFILLGLWMAARPARTPGVVTALVAVVVLAVTFGLSFPSKASAEHKLVTAFTPVMTSAQVSQVNQTLDTLGAMATELQTKMLPALAGQLHMNQAQLQGFLQSTLPTVSKTLADFPTLMGRFKGFATVLSNNLDRFKTAASVPLPTMVNTLIGITVAVLVLGLVGAATGAPPSRRSAREPAVA